MGIKHKAVKATRDKGLASEWNDDHKIDGDVDFEKYQALNLVVEQRTTFPAGPLKGQIIFRTDQNKFYVWNGTEWATFVSPATIVVAADGSGHTTSIQEGIDMLPAGGGVVYVKEGTYTENITLNKPNINVTGAGNATLVQGGISAENVSNIHIKDLQVEATGVDGVILQGCNEIVMSGCFVHSATGAGIRLRVTERSIITHNIVFDNVGIGTDGIRIAANDVGVAVGPCKNNVVSGNIVYGNTDVGIAIFATPTNENDNNCITGNRVFDNGTGIFLNSANCNNNLIDANVFGGNGTEISDFGTGTVIGDNVTLP